MRYRNLLTIGAIAGLSVVLAAGADAQFAELQPGARVRLRAPEAIAGRVVGTIIARSPDSVTLTTRHGPPIAVPLATITGAEVSRGRSRRDGAVKGLAWGTGVGLAVWALEVIAYDRSSACGEERCEDDLSPGKYVAAGVVTGATLGVGIGAIVGAEHWERIAIPTPIALRPSRGGLTVAASIRF